MLQHPAQVRAAFDDASDAFLTTVTAIDHHQWELPGALGEWTVRELTAHTLRAFSTIETYLAAEPTVDRVMVEAGDYYQVVLSDPGIHRSVAQRSRDAAQHLADPIGESEATAARVRALVASTLDDEPVNTFAGQIVFSEYLASRVVELGLHTLDLQRATGQQLRLSTATTTVLIAVLATLADPIPLLLALTGRGQLSPTFNVLG